MKNHAIVIFLFLGILSSLKAQNPVVIEIPDAEMASIYYHQNDFSEPTKLIFPNLTSVEGNVYFHQNTNLVAVEFPELTSIGDYMYFHGNELLESISAPLLNTVTSYLYVNQNTSLNEFDLCALKYILQSEDDHDPPYYSIANNNPIIDQSPCFSQGGPENFSLSTSSIAENSEPNAVIGTFSATGNYPENTFTYFFQDYDSQYFIIEGDQLKAKSTFDFEAQSEYSVYIGVFNQIGESIIQEFIISIEDVENEGIQTIEILDETLESIYYHQDNFTVQTKLVFPNLTSVADIVYFHQNVNLISVEFPKLISTGNYFYFHGNQALESLKAPVLEKVTSYFYVNQNNNLTELDVCALKSIIPSEQDEDNPYYSIANNTPSVDQTPFCFSQGPPNSLTLSETSISENLPENTPIGTFNAEGNYPENSFTYFLDYGDNDNESFLIVDNELRSDKTFDYETKNEFLVNISVYNQLGEITSKEFTIDVQDIQNEGMQTIEILDETLESLYYHQENFTNQTRLIFPNLTRVNGIVYFHQNINLTAVHLPKLSYVGDYMYFHGNQVIDTITAPSLDTVHQYLYASQNHSLKELDICSLTHILPNDNELDSTTYYYVQNNNSLDFASTCLDSTILEFDPLDSLVQSDFILVGNFVSNTTDPISHTINVDGIEQSETDEFFIIDNGLYLKNAIVEYTEESYPLSITSIRIDSEANTFLNEQILLDININIQDKEVITSTSGIEIKAELSCFPNPTNSSVTIKTTRPGMYSLTNQYGNIVELLEFRKEYNIIELIHLPPSIYYLKSSFGESIKIVKL